MATNLSMAWLSGGMAAMYQGPVTGAGEAPTVPFRVSGFEAFSLTFPGFLSWFKALQLYL